jgi:predicted acylesterase/phospholipase RssA
MKTKRKNHRNRDKIALVLAGGGLTGAVYEIGALRAMDDLLMDRTVNDFDIYVGTSAGAIVSSLLANGLSPEEMMQSIAHDHPDIPPLSHDDLFRFDPQDLVRLGFKFPRLFANAWRHYFRNLNDMNLFDLVFSLSDSLPAGLYSNASLESYMRRNLKTLGLSNKFAELERELYIIATNLDSGQRTVFSHEHHAEVPISKAVAASTALPVFYKPVRIGKHDYLDGGLRGNASLDVAIEHGATLVVCINPIVPYDNSDLVSIPFLGKDGGNLSDKGFTTIASQVGRITAHAGLHYHIKQLRKTHPEVDIILIEPSPRDYQMSFYNIMRYSAQLIVARHGFESVTLNLAENYSDYKDLLERHGITISRRLVIEELEEIQKSNYAPAVIQRVLETRAPAYRRKQGRPATHLRRVLNELADTLDTLGESVEEF